MTQDKYETAYTLLRNYVFALIIEDHNLADETMAASVRFILDNEDLGD